TVEELSVASTTCTKKLLVYKDRSECTSLRLHCLVLYQRIIRTGNAIEDIVLVAAASTPIPAARPAAKPKVLKIAAALAVSTRRKKGVVIRDPKEELHTDTPAETTVKNKGKGILIEDPKPMKKKDQIEMDVEYAKKLQEELEKEHEEAYKQIDWNAAFDHKAAKRRKLSEEAQEADDLRGRLEIVVVIDNKPRYKIIRADDTHQFYISFTTLLKNFDREDLETLWRIVKDRFFTKKPTNFSDEYLLLTLKTMFRELDEQDAIWRNQKSIHGLALVKRWKLLTSCGIHVIILSIVQLFLLVERRYPLSRFTLEQLVNVARLQVEEESKMSLELLRFTRQQLLEYQQR
nr:hypothetical protein [Tanacetum cinerariifolium]